MLRFKPEKKAGIYIYLVILLVVVGISFTAIKFHDSFGFILDIMVLILLVISVIFMFFLIPIYFARSEYIISEDEIIKNTVFIKHKHKVMPTSAVASVTVLITPLSRFTGFNMVIINALGARLFIPFISRYDCKLISRQLS